MFAKKSLINYEGRRRSEVFQNVPPRRLSLFDIATAADGGRGAGGAADDAADGVELDKKTKWELGNGNPDRKLRCNAAKVLLKSTNHRIPEDLMNGAASFKYGHKQGDPEFRERLATFLSNEYCDTVHSDELFSTAGTTHALHLLTTLLFDQGAVIYVEEPTFHFAREIIPLLGFTFVAVPSDGSGIIVEELDRLVREYEDSGFKSSDTQPYRAMVYLISVFNNPAGHCYTSDRCEKLVQIARDHDLLIFTDDVNNLLYYNSTTHAPKRLLAYDNKCDIEYKGSVLSNGSFSKILAPCVRCGWLEAPTHLINLLTSNPLADGSGNTCQYVSTILSSALKLGLLQEHVTLARTEFGRKLKKTCQILREKLPKSISFSEPQGGLHIWVQLPENVKAQELCEYCKNMYDLYFLVGEKFSSSETVDNKLRLSIAFEEFDDLLKAVNLFCKSVNEFLSHTPRHGLADEL